MYRCCSIELYARSLYDFINQYAPINLIEKNKQTDTVLGNLQKPYLRIKMHCKKNNALTGVAKLVGHHPATQKAVGSTPGQGTCMS